MSARFVARSNRTRDETSSWSTLAAPTGVSTVPKNGPLAKSSPSHLGDARQVTARAGATANGSPPGPAIAAADPAMDHRERSSTAGAASAALASGRDDASRGVG